MGPGGAWAGPGGAPPGWPMPWGMGAMPGMGGYPPWMMPPGYPPQMMPGQPGMPQPGMGMPQPGMMGLAPPPMQPPMQQPGMGMQQPGMMQQPMMMQGADGQMYMVQQPPQQLHHWWRLR